MIQVFSQAYSTWMNSAFANFSQQTRVNHIPSQDHGNLFQRLLSIRFQMLLHSIDCTTKPQLDRCSFLSCDSAMQITQWWMFCGSYVIAVIIGFENEDMIWWVVSYFMVISVCSLSPMKYFTRFPRTCCMDSVSGPTLLVTMTKACSTYQASWDCSVTVCSLLEYWMDLLTNMGMNLSI